MVDEIIKRIERDCGVSGIVEVLAERLSATDLQSLLLEVYRRRAAAKSPADVLREYQQNRFCSPSRLPPKELRYMEDFIYETLPDEIEILELAPVCPLGTSASVTQTSQNRILSTCRNTEVISDSTNVLAMECAIRRRSYLHQAAKDATMVHLAAHHRQVRAQKFSNSSYMPHFRVFALCSAGRDLGSLSFEQSCLEMHLSFYVRLMREMIDPEDIIQVECSDFVEKAGRRELHECMDRIRESNVDRVEVCLNQNRTRGRGYYQEISFLIFAAKPSGKKVEFVDGGGVNWSQELLSSAKERMFISGIGTDLLYLLYGCKGKLPSKE